jgi:hypothetical protein
MWTSILKQRKVVTLFSYTDLPGSDLASENTRFRPKPCIDNAWFYDIMKT